MVATLLVTMKTINWNTWGLGNPHGVQALHDLIHCEDLDILLLIEIKLMARRLERIQIRIGMQGCLGVDSKGRGGGLALL